MRLILHDADAALAPVPSHLTLLHSFSMCGQAPLGKVGIITEKAIASEKTEFVARCYLWECKQSAGERERREKRSVQQRNS